ncbi:MAG: DUF6115 domain-containing protein [Eubacteriales bacterium]
MTFSINALNLFLFLAGCGLIVLSYIFKPKVIKKESAHKDFNIDNETSNNNVEEPVSEKLMAINEYSDFVLEEIEKKHKELLFMYQVIAEKEKKLKMNNKTTSNSNVEVHKESKTTINSSANENQDIINNNKKILSLYNEGHSVKDIAKDLRLGIGEVKLVIDLFKEVKDD